MSERKSIQSEAEEGGKVRKELQDLRKVKVPWYFDAELQRRLADSHGGRTGAGFFVRPIPAYALSFVSVVALGIVGYYALLRPSDQGDTTLPASDSIAVGTQDREEERPQRFERRLQPILPPTQETSTPPLNQPQQGPSAPSNDQVIESGVMEKPAALDDNSGGQNIQQTPQDNPIPMGAQQVIETSRSALDTLRSIPAPKDTVDSTHVRPDSLGGRR